MAYLYKHTRLDTNEVFYIGIGSDNKYKRANTRQGRNKFWKRVVAKTDYKVDIIAFDISIEEARRNEIFFIELYGRRDLNLGTLVNLTDGGESVINLNIESQLSKKLKLKGNKNGTGNKGNIGRIVSNETKNKLKIARLNNTNAFSKQVIDLDTNIIYKSVAEAARQLGINKCTLQNWVSGRRKNKTNIKYYESNDTAND